MTICHGIPWYRNGADDHCPFIIEGWWLFFYPLSYLTLTDFLISQVLPSQCGIHIHPVYKTAYAQGCLLKIMVFLTL